MSDALAEAVAFVCSRTPLTPAFAERALRASAAYHQFCNWRAPPYAPGVDAAAVEALRKAYAALLPTDGRLDFGSQAVFIVLVANLTPQLAAAFLVAEARLCESYEADGGDPDGAERITELQARAWLATAPIAN